MYECISLWKRVSLTKMYNNVKVKRKEASRSSGGGRSETTGVSSRKRIEVDSGRGSKTSTNNYTPNKHNRSPERTRPSGTVSTSRRTKAASPVPPRRQTPPRTHTRDSDSRKERDRNREKTDTRRSREERRDKRDEEDKKDKVRSCQWSHLFSYIMESCSDKIKLWKYNYM